MLCQLKHDQDDYASDHNVFYNGQHDDGEVVTPPFPTVLRTVYKNGELSCFDHGVALK